MSRLLIIDLDLEQAAVSDLYNIWIKEHDKLVALKAECSANKHAPPNDYWKAEHEARVRYESARRLVAILETCITSK